jgi:hypothetical protein
VVLDALTANSDRKPEHVLAQPIGLGTWHVWAIDHGHTFTTSDTLTTFDPAAPMTPPMHF